MRFFSIANSSLTQNKCTKSQRIVVKFCNIDHWIRIQKFELQRRFREIAEKKPRWCLELIVTSFRSHLMDCLLSIFTMLFASLQWKKKNVSFLSQTHSKIYITLHKIIGASSTHSLCKSSSESIKQPVCCDENRACDDNLFFEIFGHFFKLKTYFSLLHLNSFFTFFSCVWDDFFSSNCIQSFKCVYCVSFQLWLHFFFHTFRSFDILAA